MTFEEIVDAVKAAFDAKVLEKIDTEASPKAIYINRINLFEVMEYLHQNDQLYFDSLSCLSALDDGAESQDLELVYNLYSIPFDHHLMVKVKIEKSKPAIKSVTDIWKTADWHEREAYDLMGIQFIGHPDLRRILMPADWEGHPLRKTYQEQVYYRGVKVKY